MSDIPTRVDDKPGSTIDADTRPNGATEEYVPRAAAQPRRDATPPPNESAPPPTPKRTRRALALPIAGIAVLLVAVAAVAYWRANLGLVKTDNAETAGDLAPVSAQVAGIVAKLDVTDNQFVRSGQMLAELDPTDYRLALSSAQANLVAAQAQVSAAQAGLTAQEQQYSTGLSVAQGALQATTPKLPQAQAQLLMEEQQTAAQVAQAEEQVTTARSAIASTKANFDTASKTLSRDRQLLAQGAISQSQVDTDNAAFESAQASYQAAQDALRQAQANLQSAQANRQQVTIAEQAITVNRGEIAQAVGTLRQAEAGNTLVQQKAQLLAAAEAQAAQAEQAVKSAQVNLEPHAGPGARGRVGHQPDRRARDGGAAEPAAAVDHAAAPTSGSSRT